MRKSPLSALDEPLARWVKFVRENKVPLTGDIIQQKDMDFAKELGLNDFSASQGWLGRFKAKHNLCGKVISGEEGDVNIVSVEQWKSRFLHFSAATDICNADETGWYSNS